jgi:hypothetical protein
MFLEFGFGILDLEFYILIHDGSKGIDISQMFMWFPCWIGRSVAQSCWLCQEY